MKKILCFCSLIVIVFSTLGFSQAPVIDSYGVRIGIGSSTQIWEDKETGNIPEYSGWQDSKTGFIGQVFAEKYISTHFSLRPSIGYIQKGFTGKDHLAYSEKIVGYYAEDSRIVLHDLSFDLALKYTPVSKKVKPYIIIGLRIDYLMDCQGIIIYYRGEYFQEQIPDPYYRLDEFTIGDKLSYGAVIGGGISYNDLFFLDFEYNPAITKNYDAYGLSIYDKYYSLTLGINIYKLVKGKGKGTSL